VTENDDKDIWIELTALKGRLNPIEKVFSNGLIKDVEELKRQMLLLQEAIKPVKKGLIAVFISVISLIVLNVVKGTILK
jgi:hypothetical protein